jgi:hypothetical protein
VRLHDRLHDREPEARAAASVRAVGARGRTLEIVVNSRGG